MEKAQLKRRAGAAAVPAAAAPAGAAAAAAGAPAVGEEKDVEDDADMDSDADTDADADADAAADVQGDAVMVDPFRDAMAALAPIFSDGTFERLTGFMDADLLIRLLIKHRITDLVLLLRYAPHFHALSVMDVGVGRLFDDIFADVNKWFAAH